MSVTKLTNRIQLDSTKISQLVQQIIRNNDAQLAHTLLAAIDDGGGGPHFFFSIGISRIDLERLAQQPAAL